MVSQKSLVEDATYNVNSDIVWLAIDARSAQQGVVSGISRFVIGLTKALAHELENRKKNLTGSKRIKLLIVSKSEPAPWVVELVHNYPDIISYWSGGPGALQKSYDKPIWLWPTFTLKRIQKLTHNQIIWFAPANFDRPLFISRNSMSSRVVQVIHDSIPFMPIKGVGFLFKRQFRFLVKRTLSRLPFVTTVSPHSAKLLQNLVKKRINPLHIIGDAVDLEFGSQPKIRQTRELYERRERFLEQLVDSEEQEKFKNVINKFLKDKWIIGVGRNQKYKLWDLAAQAIQKITPETGLEAWFIRIGADNKEISSYLKKSIPREVGEIKVFDSLKIVVLPILSDEELAEIYRISDLLVHPSIAEGFGLPPLEAALSGTPVIYRTSTAVDLHFSPGILPSNYWLGSDSSYPAIWVKQIEKILLDKKDSEFYIGLQNAESTRKFIIERANGRSFEWKESAISLLDWLIQGSDILKKVNKKSITTG
ncbi:glycosyltransferase [Fluviispira multicolorata]|uniref:Glycosyltransferase n=1 Tax=Fluviispira multicolorata TaxID=2654512 RepID=A0A833JFD7_9BACT|nr:glycosyltransferase [Fluviispira multicolorata]KAB8030879.1 glycosyltransferase [Fluviispira multicolorata]